MLFRQARIFPKKRIYRTKPGRQEATRVADSRLLIGFFCLPAPPRRRFYHQGEFVRFWQPKQKTKGPVCPSVSPQGNKTPSPETRLKTARGSLWALALSSCRIMTSEKGEESHESAKYRNRDAPSLLISTQRVRATSNRPRPCSGFFQDRDSRLLDRRRVRVDRACPKSAIRR